MPGRRPAEAVESFLAPIREAIACVAPHAYLNVKGGYHPDKNPNALILNNGEAVRLGRSGKSLAVKQQYDIVEEEEERGSYRVTTRSYIYSLRDSEGEIIGYHFHPESGVEFCHAHFRKSPEYGKVHFPTGRVAIEEVVAMAIRDLGVRPQRSDYGAVLKAGLDEFREWRTWA